MADLLSFVHLHTHLAGEQVLHEAGFLCFQFFEVRLLRDNLSCQCKHDACTFLLFLIALRDSQLC